MKKIYNWTKGLKNPIYSVRLLLLNAKFSWERKKLHLSDKIILNCNQFTSRRKKDIGAFTEICIGVNEDILFYNFFKIYYQHSLYWKLMAKSILVKITVCLINKKNIVNKISSLNLALLLIIYRIAYYRQHSAY